MVFGRKRRPQPGEPEGGEEERLAVVRAYHRRSCHDLQRYAAGPGWLDWDNQPDPFRRHEGVPRIALPHAGPDPGAGYGEVLREASLPPAALRLESVAALFEHALGLSAWKEFQGSRWALRVNPSSGNLHPTEGHALLPPMEGLDSEACLVHYLPREHAFELRARIPAELWSALTAGLPPGSFLLALSSIPWREAWKYGERAWRYCQHDAGHAIACLALSAGALGFECRIASALGSEELEALLRLAADDPDEPELAECALAVTPGRGAEPLAAPPLEVLRALEVRGRPNRLSSEHVHWQAVERVAEACRRPSRPPGPTPAREAALPDEGEAEGDRRSFRELVLARRSAVAMDARSSLPRSRFYRLLGRSRAARGTRPFESLPWSPRVSLGLFVHRVEGLAPGLYVLCRGSDHRERLAAAMNPDFAWELPEGAPEGLGLWRLLEGDVRRLASILSCHQEIAGDGVFSLGMLADFETGLAAGASVYPELYWECGAIGQILYLEAEAAGLRATGIGCYFDPAVHAAFGLRGEAFQSLYHFTVGGPVEDVRLSTRPPYPPPD